MRHVLLKRMHNLATLVALCTNACGGMTTAGTSESSPSDTGGRSGGSGSAGRAASSGGSSGVISNGGGAILLPPPKDPPPRCEPVALLYGMADAATCSWRIPPPPQGQQFMSNLVNLQFDSGDGGRNSLYYVRTPAECGAATDSWYYDDEKSPTYVALCPETCRRYSSTPAATLYVVFGCSGPLPLL